MEQKSAEHKTTDTMKSVKAACDAAPAGPKKDAAMKHLRTAEKALADKNDAECNRALEAARKALV